MKEYKSINLWALTAMTMLLATLLVSAPFWMECVEYAPAVAGYDDVGNCNTLKDYISWLPIKGKVCCITTKTLHHHVFKDVFGAIDQNKLANLKKAFSDTVGNDSIFHGIEYWHKLKEKTGAEIFLPDKINKPLILHFNAKNIDKRFSGVDVEIITDERYVWIHIFIAG